MELYKLKAHEIKELIDKRQVKAEEVTESFFKRIDKIDGELGAFLSIEKDRAVMEAKALDKRMAEGKDVGILAGIPIAIKDNISVEGMQCSCASKVLEGYIAPYDSTVAERLKRDDCIIIGKLNMDEFAMGSSNETSAFKPARNPWDTSRVPGGSSGGSAVSVAAMEVPVSLGTETGGSIRQPAALCGVVGLKPTYGRVSRYGVTALASTLDQVGPITRDVKDCALVMQSIAGMDNKDHSTASKAPQDYCKSLNIDLRGRKIGVPKEFLTAGLDDKIIKAVEDAVYVLKSNGAQIEYCSLPLPDYSLAAYSIIASAEASSNLARFDGIKYGYRTERFKDPLELCIASRSEAFGKEVKRRIMFGTYVLLPENYERYYKKALRVKNYIKQEFEKIFKEFDALVTPTTPSTAFKFGEKVEDVVSMYNSDIYTVPANIVGMPAITVPCGFNDGLPIGLHIMSNYFREDILFNTAYSYEQSTKWHDMNPKV